MRAFGYPEVVWLPKGERSFLSFIAIAFLIAMFATPYSEVAMWVGFLFAAYAAIANDSIQTIGTFIASNQDKKWWVLWIFIGGIFCLTMFYSWSQVDETGMTLFAEKVDKDISAENRNLAFYGNHTVKDDGSVKLKGSKSEGPSINLELDAASKTVSWSVPKTDITGSAQYTTDFSNIDYGLSFFLNAQGQLCEVTNLIKESDLKPGIKNTFNKYVQVDYINLITKEAGSKEISYDDKNKESLKISLFGDNVVDGDVSHARLSAKGFEKAPTNFHFLQVSAAIFLLILTRLRMPVSTTFILLTSFAATAGAVGKVLAKSMSGYMMAFILGFVFFMIVAKASKKYFVGKAKPWWTVAQWITTGSLWATWLTQDAANIAVFLPRKLSGLEFFGFISVVTIGLGILLYYKGGRIQKIVTEKSVVTDVRFATLIDLIYCVILFYFKLHSKVPMSTTWVFIGLLAGRELGMSMMKTGSHTILSGLKLALKDVTFALIGLAVSIAIAVGVNENLTFTAVITEIPDAFASGITKFFSKLGF